MITSILLIAGFLVLGLLLSVIFTLLTSYRPDMKARRRYGIPTETLGQYIKGNLLFMVGRDDR